MMFRQLSPEQEESFRRWARENYRPFEKISGVWHPAVQDECVKINTETGYSPGVADPSGETEED